MHLKTKLEKLYAKYNRPELINPDPLQFLGIYKDVKDREIVALIASSLAYGRVAQILKSVDCVLSRMRPGPRAFLERSSEKKIQETFAGFKHRFTTDDDLKDLLLGIKKVLQKHGSLNQCFVQHYDEQHETILPALENFVKEITHEGEGTKLLPCPSRKSACKRLNLFLRWMVRNDAVDPGGWEGVCTSKLIVPLDTHMHKIALSLGMTKRKQANMRTALEITRSFAKIFPQDPVKYDFALTRFGIRNDMDIKEII
ncbi:MAG: TIGR02757 family protein [Pseudomonadota bacterium]